MVVGKIASSNNFNTILAPKVTFSRKILKSFSPKIPLTVSLFHQYTPLPKHAFPEAA